MPPNAELRPPRPGEPRPQEVTPADQAKEALSPALAGRTQQRVAGGAARRRPHRLGAGAGRQGRRRQHRSQHSQPGQPGHQDHQRQRQVVHRQPDLLAGAGALRRGDRSGQGAAAHPRRPGGRPARVPAPRPPSRGASAACSKAFSESGTAPPPRSARRPRGGGALASQPPAVAKLFSVERRRAEAFTLANGLQVVVLPSSRAPIVNQLVVYKAGSADEVVAQDRRRAFPRAHDVQGHGHGGAHRVLAHRVEERRPRQRLHRLRFDRLLPDRIARPARARHAHGSRPHDQPAHHREGADPRAPGRARGTPHADREFARPRSSTRRCRSSCSAATSPTACRRAAMSTTSRSSASAT